MRNQIGQFSDVRSTDRQASGTKRCTTLALETISPAQIVFIYSPFHEKPSLTRRLFSFRFITSTLKYCIWPAQVKQTIFHWQKSEQTTSFIISLSLHSLFLSLFSSFRFILLFISYLSLYFYAYFPFHSLISFHFSIFSVCLFASTCGLFVFYYDSSFFSINPFFWNIL